MMKRLVAIADTHCGHLAGLTPPEYQLPESEIDRAKFAKQQRIMWDWYCQTLKALRPVYCLLTCGDMVDGKGSRSGSTECLVVDPLEQADMAEEAMLVSQAQVYRMVYGTPYHTGVEADYESIIYRSLKAGGRDVDISRHAFFSLNGVKFDVKHKVGGSQVPYGRTTAAARDKFWNVAWNALGLQDKADYYLRAHNHYFNLQRDEFGTIVQLPALQGFGSKYGSGQCSGTISIGLVAIDCEDGRATVRDYLLDMTWAKEVAKEI